MRCALVALALSIVAVVPSVGASQTVSTPIDVNGSTSTAACASFVVTFLCQTVIDGSDPSTPLDHPGAGLRFSGQLTWHALTPATQVLGIGLVVFHDGVPEPVPGAFAEGASPLILDWDLSGLGSQTVVAHVSHYTSAGPTPSAHVDVTFQQAWRLAGTITSVA